MKQTNAMKRTGLRFIFGSLFALFLTAGLFAQPRQITGTVTDANGPVPGASVTVKGTSVGTISAATGTYTINAAPNATLVFSFMGYKTVEIEVADRNRIDVSLEDDVTGLDEVVVIGYGTIRKRDLTGSVASVRGEALTLSPAVNPLINIQGKVPGLDITQTSGQPGEKMEIQLRGNRSFTADSDPLFLIDGMPGDYATLNPNDILSIEVLKDASSTAIYGASGANGVIIITTKKPEVGRVSIDFNAYYGFNGWSLVPDMRGDNSGYITALRDAGKAAGRWNSSADDANLFQSQEDYELYSQGHLLNWNKALMQDASVQNYSLSVSGGNEKTKAYLSLNYSDERGQYKNDSYKVYSTVMRVENQAAKWMKIGANLQGSYVDRSLAYSNLENALKMYPIGKMYNDDGSINPHPVSGSRVYNLLLNSQEGVYDNLQNNIRVYFHPYIEINPLPGLSIMTRAGVSLVNKKTKYFQGFESYQWYEAGQTDASVQAKVTDDQTTNYTWENIVTYNRNFNGHDFTLTGVTTWAHNQHDNMWTQQTNIKDNVYKWYNLDKSSTTTTAESTYDMSKTMGYIGRINYSYNGKYLASASIRHDGSSKLYSDKRWSTFPAFAVGWRISEENFMSNTNNWLDNLKLRLSYGVTGTDNIKAYSSVQVLESGNQLVGGMAQGIWKYSQKVTNPNLTWEKSKTFDIGLDVSVFKGRIHLAVDWYSTKTTGVLYERPLPIVFGAYTTGNSGLYMQTMNIAATKNTGWEIALNTVNIANGDLRWTSTVTFSANKEKITKLFGGDANFLDVSSTEGKLSNCVLKLGEPVQSYWNYKLNGIWQSGEEADAAVFNAAPGDIKIDIADMHKEADGRFYKYDENGGKVYYDADNKYSVSSEDYQIIGQKSPKWQLGFQNTFTYKGFDLSIYAFMRMGQMIKYDLVGAYDPSGKENFPNYFDYWTAENGGNKYPGINADKSITDYTGYNALPYVDGSFFKIKNITLGYTLPSHLLEKFHISKLRVYGTITNPLIISKSSWIKEYDPEMAGSIKYPLTRQLVFGVNLTF